MRTAFAFLPETPELTESRERYTLTELPDGFEAVYTVDNDASFTVVYRNEDGEEIILSRA